MKECEDGTAMKAIAKNANLKKQSQSDPLSGVIKHFHWFFRFNSTCIMSTALCLVVVHHSLCCTHQDSIPFP